MVPGTPEAGDVMLQVLTLSQRPLQLVAGTPDGLDGHPSNRWSQDTQQLRSLRPQDR